MSYPRYKCNECATLTRTTKKIGCQNCGSLNIELTKGEQRKLNNNKIETSTIIYLIKIVLFIVIGIILVLAFLVIIGVFGITTEGCSLPVDLLLGDICFFGSLGASFIASLGLTLAVSIIFGLGKTALRILEKLFR